MNRWTLSNNTPDHGPAIKRRANNNLQERLHIISVNGKRMYNMNIGAITIPWCIKQLCCKKESYSCASKFMPTSLERHCPKYYYSRIWDQVGIYAKDG